MSEPAKVVHLHDICIDCDGLKVYPSGAPCKSCGGTGRVNRGDGIPPDAPYAPGRCTCQEQHRRGYCTEPGCPMTSQHQTTHHQQEK